MKRYTPAGRIAQVVCNRCKKEMKVENGIIKEGCFCANAKFGYFSRKDGQKHAFDLCEDCYDALIKEFAIPVTSVEETELC